MKGGGLRNFLAFTWVKTLNQYFSAFYQILSFFLSFTQISILLLWYRVWIILPPLYISPVDTERTQVVRSRGRSSHGPSQSKKTELQKLPCFYFETRSFLLFLSHSPTFFSTQTRGGARSPGRRGRRVLLQAVDELQVCGGPTRLFKLNNVSCEALKVLLCISFSTSLDWQLFVRGSLARNFDCTATSGPPAVGIEEDLPSPPRVERMSSRWSKHRGPAGVEWAAPGTRTMVRPLTFLLTAEAVWTQASAEWARFSFLLFF